MGEGLFDCRRAATRKMSTVKRFLRDVTRLGTNAIERVSQSTGFDLIPLLLSILTSEVLEGRAGSNPLHLNGWDGKGVLRSQRGGFSDTVE